ncbi:MAG: glycosyltransferase family 4 protein [Acidobacteriota bacterium]
MRILQVCPYDWHAPGGVQTHVRELTRELQRIGHDVIVAAPGRRRESDPDLRIVGRPIRIPFNGTVAPVCVNPMAAWRLHRLLRTFRPDIVHAHEPFAPSVALFAGVLTTAPLVATFHAHVDLKIGRAMYGVGTWPFNWRGTAGIAVSEEAVRWLSPRVRVPIRIVPNGVDRALFSVDRVQPPARRILFAHRLEPRKGFGVALAAFGQVLASCPDVELVVVGDGRERTLVDALPDSVRARVRMRGVVSREALIAEFAAASVFVAPALNGESFGVVLLEAMAAGLPIVASAVDGYRRLLSGGGATLVTPGDAKGLSDGLVHYLDNPALGRATGEVGRTRAAAYTWDRVAVAVESVYAFAAASRNNLRASAAT